MIRRTVLLGLLLMASVVCEAGDVGQSPVAVGGHPPVYDATMYAKKPDLSVFGVRKLNLVYAHKFWADMHDKGAIENLPSERKVRGVARSMPRTREPVCIDVEHWPLTGNQALVDQSVIKYSKLVDWFKSERPDLSVGLFGMMPIADYHRSRRGRSSSAYAEWQAENDRLRPLVGHVDVIFPYLYTYYPDKDAWVQFAIENLREARRYGKPVYVFLWPQYSEKNTSIGYQYIPAEYWKLQLETVSPYVDGIVIWGGWDREKKRPANWDSSAEWWRVTKEFINTGR